MLLQRQRKRGGNMIFSDMALKTVYLKERGAFKTKTQFWKDFGSDEKINDYILKDKEFLNGKESIVKKLESSLADGIFCAFDVGFPKSGAKIKNSERPYLLYYKGNIDLLKRIENNIAVIGVLNPNNGVVEREKGVVSCLLQKGMTIVSGLAKGCDAIAHEECVYHNGKTIAILPSTIKNILPAANRHLAQSIVDNGGLLITEYIDEPLSRYEATGRYIERDRLQALFSKAIVLIASYAQGKGDSGARHAINYAESYGVARYALFDKSSDLNDEQFELNKILIEDNKVKIWQSTSLDELYDKQKEKKEIFVEQMRWI